MNFFRPRDGFTLLELSVVIVIIGLIVGAVMGGTRMLRQSELQGVVVDYTKYSAAVANFRQQYGGLPGDLIDATTYWNSGGGTGVVTDATCRAGITATATCNGDSDGDMSDAYEPYTAWQHLMLAKLIKGSYTGIDTGDANPGTNVPKSVVNTAGWSFGYKAATGAQATPPVAADTDLYDQQLKNYLAFGGVISGSGDLTNVGIITPEDAWQIDTKLDNGLPGTGRIVTRKPAALAGCADSDTDASAVYLRTTKGKTCSLNMSLTLK